MLDIRPVPLELTLELVQRRTKRQFTFPDWYHLNNTGELDTNRDILISEHGDIETFTPTY